GVPFVRFRATSSRTAVSQVVSHSRTVMRLGSTCSPVQSLPFPVPGGTVDNLRRFLNVKNDDDFVLALAWLLAALRDRGPYPVLALSGEQGSAKSSFSTILRSLVDPNTAPLRALPREDRDCSSPPITATRLPSTTCHHRPTRYLTRFVGLRPGAASRCANSTPTRT